MSPEKQREIASKGGRAAHQKGTAHEWSSDEAREAGRKGGMASRGGRGKLPRGRRRMHRPLTPLDARSSPTEPARSPQPASTSVSRAAIAGLRDRGSRSSLSRLFLQPAVAGSSSSTSHFLDLHARVVEARAAAQIGQRIGHQRIRREAVGDVCAARRPFGIDTVPAPHERRHTRRQPHLAQLVEHPHDLAVLDAARGGVVGMNVESHGGSRQLAERRADGALAGR